MPIRRRSAYDLKARKLRDLARHRGLKLISNKGRFTVQGDGVKFGPAPYGPTRAWLSAFTTAKAATPVAALRQSYRSPLYDPAAGEEYPASLIGLKPVMIRLPVGANSDDALRGLWRAESRAQRRAAPEIVAKLDEARAMLRHADLAPVAVVISDHDLKSAEMMGVDLQTMLLAAWLSRVAVIPARRGTR